MIPLTKLNPRWVSSGGEGITDSRTGKPVPQRERVGVTFDCPCGTCGVRGYIPFKNPIDPRAEENPAGWHRHGDTFETLSLHPSIFRPAPHGCGWHGFLTTGVFAPC